MTEINLPDRMDIASAEQLHMTMEAALAEGSAISLKANSVSKIDTTGVQLLLGLFREADKQHLDVNWCEPSETILDAMELFNLQNEVRLIRCVEA